MIGADGNTSAVRSLLFPGEAPRFNGQVAFRALIPDELVPDVIRQRQLAMQSPPHGATCCTIPCGAGGS